MSGKLMLNKTAVSQLNTNEQKAIRGGLADDEKTKTGPAVCTAMVTAHCCDDKTKTGPAVCTAMVTYACCDGRG